MKPPALPGVVSLPHLKSRVVQQALLRCPAHPLQVFPDSLLAVWRFEATGRGRLLLGLFWLFHLVRHLQRWVIPQPFARRPVHPLKATADCFLAVCLRGALGGGRRGWLCRAGY